MANNQIARLIQDRRSESARVEQFINPMPDDQLSFGPAPEVLISPGVSFMWRMRNQNSRPEFAASYALQGNDGVSTFTAKKPNASAMDAIDWCGACAFFEERIGEGLKELPLFLPFDGVYDLPQVPLVNPFYRWQEQNLLLNVRRKVQ